MIRRPPRSTQSRSSAASDVYKRQVLDGEVQRVGGEVGAVHLVRRQVAERLGDGLVRDLDRLGEGLTLDHLGDHARRGDGRAAAERLEPVSYTHLRAHETRHDIVCRLLLEKKK